MKANELMIGDWVKKPSFTDIESLKIGQLELDDFAAEEEYGVLSACEPIPLTPEILEKNDFKKHSGGGYIIKELTDDEIPTFYIWDGNDSLYVVDYYSANTYTYIKRCEYVHELQHELTSCNIEKEIVL